MDGIMSIQKVWIDRGHKCDILCLDPDDVPGNRLKESTIYRMGYSGPIYSILSKTIPILRYGYTHRFAKWLKINAGNYDAVIINGLWNYASYGSWRALRKSEVPYFVFTHGMLSPWFKITYPIKSWLKSIFWKCIENRVLRDACAVLFTCEEERRLSEKSFSPYRANEVVTGFCSRGISPNCAAQRSAFYRLVPKVLERKFILFLGRIHPVKGIDLLIEAFATISTKFPKYDLVIAGPDQNGWQEKLLNLADSHGIGARAHWPGMLTGDAKWGAFRECEIFALPSHQENFGVVIPEAMSASKPILTSDKVNIWRELQADGAAIVVSDDVDSVRLGLERLLEMPPAEREKMGKAALRAFQKRYDVANFAVELQETIGSIVADRAKKHSKNTNSVNF